MGHHQPNRSISANSNSGKSILDMKLPKGLITVTPLSKFLAMILFVSLPVVGFLLGMRHQQIISSPSIITNYPTPTPSSESGSGCYYIENSEAACPKKDCGKILICSTPAPDETANWKAYTNDKYGFEIKYHPESEPQENIGNEISGQFTYLLLVRFGTNPIKSTYGYELRVSKQSLDSYREELVGHITDKIDSEEQIVINDNNWTKINYQIFLTTDYVPVTMVITNHAGYSYAITSSAMDIDQILATFKFTDQEDQVACTLDAKLCPDGSYVSRQPPNCEFAACP
jgi:hypothetical protein